MNLGLDFRRGPDALPDAIEQLAARVNVLWSKEHDPATGAHRNITAKSITADSLTLGGTTLTGTELSDVAFKSAANVFTKDQTIAMTYPTLWLRHEVGATNLKDWAIAGTGDQFQIQYWDDAHAVNRVPLIVSRTDMTPVQVTNRVIVTGNLLLQTGSASPDTSVRLKFYDAAQPVDARRFEIALINQEVWFRFRNDAETTTQANFVFTRSPAMFSTNGGISSGNISCGLISASGSITTSSTLSTGGPITAKPDVTQIFLNGYAYAGGSADILFRDSAGNPWAYLRCAAAHQFEFLLADRQPMYNLNSTAFHGRPDGARILGYSLFFWANTYSNVFTAKAGSASAPVFTFDGNASSGMYIDADGGLSLTSVGYRFFTANAYVGRNYSHTHLCPFGDNTANLGDATYRWVSVYAVNGTINTSDIRLKDVKGPTRLGIDFIKRLNPVEYTWTTGSGKRRHGIIAQELKQVLDELAVEFDGVYEPETDECAWGLNYCELIAPIIKAIQELDAKVNALRSEHGAEAHS